MPINIIVPKGLDTVELQIQDLISSIKKDGIDAAQAEADAIIAKAKSNAADIIARANEEAAKIIAGAKSETDILKESARVDAEHSRRDAVLSFKKAIQAEFEKILAAETAKTVQGETLAKLIAAALNGENPADYTAEVHEINEALKSGLAEKLRAGLEIRVSPDVRRGFRLAAKDGSGYFDCSDEEITDMLVKFSSALTV